MVTGLDISKPDAGAARNGARRRRRMSRSSRPTLSAHPFTPEFDLLFSRFGVMFFADPVAAFANIRKALKPGGRLAFVCWRACRTIPGRRRRLPPQADLLPVSRRPIPTRPVLFAFADPVRLQVDPRARRASTSVEDREARQP